jgi:transposase
MKCSYHTLFQRRGAVNRLDDAIFDAAYPGCGRDSYHPKLLSEVIIYACTQRINSSCQIAKAVREILLFMAGAGWTKTPQLSNAESLLSVIRRTAKHYLPRFARCPEPDNHFPTFCLGAAFLQQTAFAVYAQFSIFPTFYF